MESEELCLEIKEAQIRERRHSIFINHSKRSLLIHEHGCTFYSTWLLIKTRWTHSFTPFKFSISPTYNISITQVAVEDNVSSVNFDAIFDSGTSFTYVDDPAYSIITKNVSSVTCYLSDFVFFCILHWKSSFVVFSSILKCKSRAINLIPIFLLNTAMT